MKFNIAAIKQNAMTNRLGNLDLIRDYGLSHYDVFDSRFSECGGYEIFIDITPGSLNLRSGKYGYALEVQIFSILPGVDLEGDGYHDQMIESLERTLVQNRADLWRIISRTVRNANQKVKASQ